MHCGWGLPLEESSNNTAKQWSMIYFGTRASERHFVRGYKTSFGPLPKVGEGQNRGEEGDSFGAQVCQDFRCRAQVYLPMQHWSVVKASGFPALHPSKHLTLSCKSSDYWRNLGGGGRGGGRGCWRTSMGGWQTWGVSQESLWNLEHATPPHAC